MLLFITINFYTITDILLAAFIFYQVYKLVKGTVAINIFAGIFTFYVAWLLVKALNLELVSGILGQERQQARPIIPSNSRRSIVH